MAAFAGIAGQIGLALWLVLPGLGHAADSTLCGTALVDALRSGGFNLYFRHAATEWSQSDDVRERDDWISCDSSRMRQLSEEGRQTSQRVGAAMRALEIPVGAVHASPYCRTVETATLMDIGRVETTTDVMNLRAAAFFDGRNAIVARAGDRLGMPPDSGENAVFVAHGNVAQAATGVYPEEGEMLVFRPKGQGEFAFVGRLAPPQWRDLEGACE